MNQHLHLPQVSVGLPVYNGENFLARALDSLLHQTYGDFELVISDNASTDGTQDICRRYAGRDARIRYSRQHENRGVAWNFNEVFRLARGKYFKWMAHDDLCEPTFLARAVEVLEDDSSVVLCTSKTVFIDAAGVPRCSGGHAGPVEPPRRFDFPKPHQRYLDVLINTTWGIEFYGLIRSDVLRRTGLHRPYLHAEKVLIAELALRGKFCEIPEALLLTRKHGEQVSQVASVAEQTFMVNPQASRRFMLPHRAQSTWGYLCIAAGARLGIVEKSRCLLGLVRYLMQSKKWKRVLTEAVTGIATVGRTPTDSDQSRREGVADARPSVPKGVST